MRSDPMPLAELAARLGRSRDWLYRHRNRLHADDGLPPPLTRGGRPMWDRASIEAWLTRHHPARPAQAANDSVRPPPRDDDGWRAALAAEYTAR